MWFTTLYKLRLLTPRGLYFLVGSIRLYGFNMMAMVRFYAKIKPGEIALIEGGENITYLDLFVRCMSQLHKLCADEKFMQVRKIAVVKRNDSGLVITIAVLSCLGKEIVLVNPDIGSKMISAVLKNARIHHGILDEEIVLEETFNKIEISTGSDRESKENSDMKFKKKGQSNITILTSGTTGVNIPVKRKMNPLKFLNPFFDLTKKLNLLEVERLYIGVPICHGYGMAAFTMGLAMGRTIVLDKNFEQEKSKVLIEKSQSDCLVLVPIMIKRLFHQEKGFENVRRVISGGAPLTKTVANTLLQLPEVELFNLYGTSEVGVSFCDKVKLGQSIQIGKPLKGVKYKLDNLANSEGELYVKSAWSQNNRSWIGTGDICAVSDDGNLIWKSRKDEMIISGGENVYPDSLTDFVSEIDGVVGAHTSVIDDEEFGKRLLLFVQVENDSLDAGAIKEIIKNNLPRYLQPKIIKIVDTMPYNELGKIPRSVLQHTSTK